MVWSISLVDNIKFEIHVYCIYSVCKGKIYTKWHWKRMWDNNNTTRKLYPRSKVQRFPRRMRSGASWRGTPGCAAARSRTVEERGMTPCFDVVIPPQTAISWAEHNSLTVFFLLCASCSVFLGGRFGVLHSPSPSSRRMLDACPRG